MVIFYKKWKKYNEIQLTKNKMDLNNQKMTNHPPSPEKQIKGTVLVESSFFYHTFLCNYAQKNYCTEKNYNYYFCSCLFQFVWLIFIGLVQGRCGQVSLTQNNFNHSIFVSEEKKKHCTQNCMHYNISTQIFNFHFHLFLKNMFKNISKNLSNCLIIYVIIMN